MAELNPRVPQVNDPELEANVIRLLQVVGPLGKLNVADVVIPTINLGNAVPLSVIVEQPSFRSTDLFSAGNQTSAAANTVHADTGPLAAGIFDMIWNIDTGQEGGGIFWEVQHRNAANAANLASMPLAGNAGQAISYQLRLSYQLALNERIRILNITAYGGGSRSSASIFARLRT